MSTIGPSKLKKKKKKHDDRNKPTKPIGNKKDKSAPSLTTWSLGKSHRSVYIGDWGAINRGNEEMREFKR